METVIGGQTGGKLSSFPVYVFCLDYKSSPKPTATPVPVHHIKITASGTINVRTKADAKSSRVGHAKNGETYELLETASNGWFKIRLKDGKEGYVSGNMAEKID